MSFVVLGLEPGEHTLTFTLRTRHGLKDVLEKKLRVVVRPCGGGQSWGAMNKVLSHFSLKASGGR